MYGIFRHPQLLLAATLSGRTHIRPQPVVAGTPIPESRGCRSGPASGQHSRHPAGRQSQPLLANISLHYVLDLWFERKFKPRAKGYVQLIRDCDDFVVCCESQQDATAFLVALKDRFQTFSLSLSPDRTKVVKFGRRAWQLAKKSGRKPETFNFLGFTHYCGTRRRGYFVMGHKTSKQNLHRKIQEIKEWLKRVSKHLPLKDWWPVLKAKLTGHYSYFGISGNIRCLKQFYFQVRNAVF